MASLRTKILVRMVLSILVVEIILLGLTLAHQRKHLLKSHMETTSSEVASKNPEMMGDYREVRRQLAATAFSIAGIIFIIILGTSVLVYFCLNQVVMTPVRRLIKANEALAEGRTDACEIKPSEMPNDEIGDIMRSRSRMLGILQKTQNDMEDLNAGLERQVEQRTGELQDALDQLKETHAGLVQAEKLSTLGAVSASVAHELNQPLTALRLILSELDKSAEKGSQDADDIRVGLEQVDRMSEITKNLSRFARKPGSPHAVDIRHSIRKACDLILHSLKDTSIRMELDLPDTLPAVKADDPLIQQIVINLLANARDAVLEAKQQTNKIIKVSVSAEKDNIVLKVYDNGTGISEDLQPRLFKSFVTTKPPEQGTGLGLAISRDIVSKLGGSISFETIPGQETTFRVELPICTGDIEDSSHEKAPDSSSTVSV